MARRLLLYFIGFSIGSIIVYFLFFKDKDRSFFPSGIVLDSLRSKDIIIDQRTACMLACYEINEKNLKDLLDDGDVNFSKSSPRQEPKIYLVETDAPNGEELELKFELGSQAKLLSVFPLKENCSCN